MDATLVNQIIITFRASPIQDSLVWSKDINGQQCDIKRFTWLMQPNEATDGNDNTLFFVTPMKYICETTLEQYV